MYFFHKTAFFYKTAYNLKQFFFSLHKTLRAGLNKQKKFHQLNDKDISIQEEILFLVQNCTTISNSKKTEKNIAYFRLILIEFIAKIASLLTSFTDECK